MFKKRIVAVIAGLLLLAAVAGSTSLVADAIGQPLTPAAHACSSGSAGGGGC